MPAPPNMRRTVTGRNGVKSSRMNSGSKRPSPTGSYAAAKPPFAVPVCCAKTYRATDTSDPPPDPADIGVELCAELPAHARLLERNVHPVRSGENRERSKKHRPRADPEGDAQGGDHDREIHGVAR